MSVDQLDDFQAMHVFMPPERFAGQKTGIYARVSSRGQSTKDKTSLDEQVRVSRDYAARFGLIVDEAAVIREAHTSLTLDRPELNQLLADMTSRDITNLIMDRVDRTTREGQPAALEFLNGLTARGIVLHVTFPMVLVVVGDAAIRQFLDLAYYAKLESAQRTRNIKINRRARAREQGRYVRGNRAPYGFRFDPEDPRHRLFPDDGPDGTYETLKWMCQQRLVGRPLRSIARDLTARGVPTARTRAGEQITRNNWTANVVRRLVERPLNAGIVTAFRRKYGPIQPADTRHKHVWRTVEELPVDEQMALPSDLVVNPPLTVDEHKALLAMHGERWKPKYQEVAKDALLRGGLVKHDCSGTLKLSRRKNRWSTSGETYSYYTCRLHQHEPLSCPGGTISARKLDRMVWNYVRENALQPGQIETLAAAQIDAELKGQPGSQLDVLKQTLKDARRTADNYLKRIGQLDSYDQSDRPVIALYEREMRQALDIVAETEARIVEQERSLADWESHRQLIADVQYQIVRYGQVIAMLDPDSPFWIPTLARTVLLALGTTVKAWREGREIRFEVTFDLGQAALRPWFTEEPPAQFSPEELEQGYEQFAPRDRPILVAQRWVMDFMWMHLVREYGETEAQRRALEYLDRTIAEYLETGEPPKWAASPEQWLVEPEHIQLVPGLHSPRRAS